MAAFSALPPIPFPSSRSSLLAPSLSRAAFCPAVRARAAPTSAAPPSSPLLPVLAAHMTDAVEPVYVDNDVIERPDDEDDTPPLADAGLDDSPTPFGFPVPSDSASGFGSLASLAGSERAVGINFGSHRMRVFSGSSNTNLASDIARYVGKTDTSAILRKRFSDNESYVKIEESVRGCNVFLVQATSDPANDNLIELLIMVDACRRAHAHQITAVIPYYGYARADRLIDPDKRRREALTSKLVANMLCAAGTDRVVLVDIHSPQTCGFFDIPVDHVYAGPILVDYLNSKQLSDVVVVAPDVGGVSRARAFAKGAGDAPLAIIDKRRDGHNQSKVLNLVGDVEGKTAVLVDDMIDTAGTICNAAKMLREKGARQVLAFCTHPVFSGPAKDRLSSGVFEEVVVCDTINVPRERRFEQLTILSVASIVGEQIWRVHEQSSR